MTDSPKEHGFLFPMVFSENDAITTPGHGHKPSGIPNTINVTD